MTFTSLLPTLILGMIVVYLIHRVYVLTQALQYTLSAQGHMMLAMESLQMQVVQQQQIFDQIIELEEEEAQQWESSVH